MDFIEWAPNNDGTSAHRRGPFVEGQFWTPTFKAGAAPRAIQSTYPADYLYEYRRTVQPAGIAYHSTQSVLVQNGADGQPGTYIEQTWQQTPVSMDELLTIKQQELTDYTGFVLSANAQSSQVTNWVIVLDDIQRTWIASVINFLHDRMKDILIDSEAKPYWPRDVPIVIVNKNTDERDRPNVTEAQWGTVIKDIGLHDFAATDANELVIADINAAYGDGTGTPGGPEWTSLANIDVTSAVYGWPPVYDTNVNSTSFNGGGGD